MHADSQPRAPFLAGLRTSTDSNLRPLARFGLVALALWTCTFGVVAVGATWAKRSVANPAGLERTMLEVAERPVVRRAFANALTANATPENGRLVLRDLPAIYGAADSTVTSAAFAQVVLLAVQEASARSGRSPNGGVARTSQLFAAMLRRTRPDLADHLPAETIPVLDITEAGVLHRSLLVADRLARERSRALVGAASGALIGLWCSRTRFRRLSWLGAVLIGAAVALATSRVVIISALTSGVKSGPDRVLLVAVMKGASEPAALAWISAAWGVTLLVGSLFAATGRIGSAGVQLEPVTPNRRIEQRNHARSRGSVDRSAVRGRDRTIVGVAVALLVATIGLWPHGAKAGRALTCLGARELCDRPLDRITLAATHNSMNNRADGFVFPEHESDVRTQLEHGIRGFLIDTHYGKASTDGRIWTDLIGMDRAELIRSYGQAAVEAGEQARAQRVEPSSDRGVYLCHNYCELGATPLRTTLIVIRDFLDSHPTEVVLLDIQDQTSPEDTVHEFEAVRLTDSVYTPIASEPWPSVRKLIAARTRLIVLTENETGAAAWYQRGYDRLLTDTPYSATQLADLNGCQADRGPRSASLLLMNHWLDQFPPRPSVASNSNAVDFIVKRATICLRVRGRYPNIIAVNWSEIGDVVGAASKLNRRPR